MAIILCLLTGLLPVIITPGLFLYFDITPKILILLISLAAAIVPVIRENHYFSAAGRYLMAAVGVQTLALLLATALSIQPSLSIAGTNWRRFGTISQLAVFMFTIMAVMTMARRNYAFIWLLRTVAASGSLVAVYAVLQYLGLDPFLPSASYTVGEGIFAIVRPPATEGHADYLAVYLLFPIFAGLALNRKEHSKSMQLLGLGSTAIAGIALILTGTRAAWLGLFVGTSFLIFRLKPRFRVAHAYRAAAIILVFGVLLLSPIGARFRARVHWIREDVFGGARLLLWRDSLRMAGARWISGFGPECFGAVFPRYQSVELARQYPDFYHESPHNIFLDTLCEQGSIGLLGLLLTTAAGFSFAAAVRRDSPAVFLAGAFVAIFISLQFQAFTVSSALFYYLAVAVLSSEANGKTDEMPKRWRWSVAALYAIPIPLFLWFGVRLAAAEYEIAAVPRDIAVGNAGAAIARYQQVLRWQPPGVSYDLFYSRQMLQYAVAKRGTFAAVGAGRQAIEAGIRATGYLPERQNALYHLATLFAAADDVPDTEKYLREAISAAPHWFKPHWTLAQLLALTGRRKEAKSEASIAVELDGGKHPEVAHTLLDLERSPRT